MFTNGQPIFRPTVPRCSRPPAPLPAPHCVCVQSGMGTTDSKAVLVADVVRMKAASLSDHDCESFDRLLELPVGVMVRVHAVCVCVTCAAPRSIPQCCAAGAVAPISAVGFSYSPSPLPALRLLLPPPRPHCAGHICAAATRRHPLPAPVSAEKLGATCASRAWLHVAGAVCVSPSPLPDMILMLQHVCVCVSPCAV